MICNPLYVSLLFWLQTATTSHFPRVVNPLRREGFFTMITFTINEKFATKLLKSLCNFEIIVIDKRRHRDLGRVLSFLD